MLKHKKVSNVRPKGRPRNPKKVTPTSVYLPSNCRELLNSLSKRSGKLEPHNLSWQLRAALELLPDLEHLSPEKVKAAFEATKNP